jgi:hypothetical protein
MAKKSVKETKIEAKLRRAKTQLRLNLARYIARDPRLRNLNSELAKRLELGRLSGVSRTSLDRYLAVKTDDEEGADQGHAGLNNLIRLADTFGISVLELLANVHDAYPGHDQADPGNVGGGSNGSIVVLDS